LTVSMMAGTLWDRFDGTIRAVSGIRYSEKAGESLPQGLLYHDFVSCALCQDKHKRAKPAVMYVER
jgi:hypothetical protein